MIFTEKIYRAIKFASKTHQVYQDQKRKGKSVPYITHPLTVGLILSLYGAGEDTICAGVLHDTIEDSPKEKKVTKEMLAERFGAAVADLVESVTDKKELPKEERKLEVLERIKNFSHESVLIKSADVMSNISEILDDHGRTGDEVFKRFSESKELTIKKYLDIAQALEIRWKGSPMNEQLQELAGQLKNL